MYCVIQALRGGFTDPVFQSLYDKQYIVVSGTSTVALPVSLCLPMAWEAALARDDHLELSPNGNAGMLLVFRIYGLISVNSLLEQRN